MKHAISTIIHSALTGESPDARMGRILVPSVREWSGRVLRPSKAFQPIGWGFGFCVGDRSPEGFGLVILPPEFEAAVRVRVWKLPSETFSLPTKRIAEEVHPLCLVGKPKTLATMVWFPLPDLAPGAYVVDVALLKEGQPQPFAVGIYETRVWSWRAGVFTTDEGTIRAAKVPVGLVWDVGDIPRDPERTFSVEGIDVPQPAHSRYDVISVDATGTLHLTTGPDRELDPEEFPAVAPEGHSVRYVLHTNAGGAEVISVHEWRDGVRIGEEGRHREWLDMCRDRLPLTFAKLRRRENILLAGYGDSITSLGSRAPDQILAPNGSRRDTLRHFQCYGEDWKSSVPLYNGHHRLGWNHVLKAAIEDQWGVQVRYDNWGLAGTTSESNTRAIDGFNYPNASNPARLEIMLADNPDLVVVAVGMNDIGDPIDTGGNILAIGNAIMSAGAEMIIVAPPRQNPNFHSRDDILWKYTHDRVVDAAQILGAAYLATADLYERTGAMGLSRQSHCSASFTNHPGARELHEVGKYLSKIFVRAS